jgi:hypothetical protein
MTIETKRVPPGVAGGATNRISGAITASATKRVVGAITESITRRVPISVLGTGPFLLLEGDSTGALAYEGVDTSGYLKLEGTY